MIGTRGFRIGRLCVFASRAPFSFGKWPTMWARERGGSLAWGAFEVGWQVLPPTSANQ